MGTKKKKGMAFNNLELSTETKEQFRTLCAQYEQMGKLFSLQSKAMTHPMFSKSTVPEVHNRILMQYMEMGEALKNIGTCLDMMPGKNVLKEDKISMEELKSIDIDTRKKELKKMEDLSRTKEGEGGKTFVSNIKPEEKKDK